MAKVKFNELSFKNLVAASYNRSQKLDNQNKGSLRIEIRKGMRVVFKDRQAIKARLSLLSQMKR